VNRSSERGKMSMSSIAINYRIESAKDWDNILAHIRSDVSNKRVKINVFDESGEELDIPSGVGYVKTTKNSSIQNIFESVFNGENGNEDVSGFCVLQKNQLIVLSSVEDWFSGPVDIVYGDHMQNGIRMYKKSPPVVNMHTPALFISRRLITKEILSRGVSGETLGMIFSSCVRAVHIPKVLSRIF